MKDKKKKKKEKKLSESQKQFFLEMYRADKFRELSLARPDVDSSILFKLIDDDIAENFKDTNCIIENNYTGAVEKLVLTDFIDWWNKEKPITVENGGLFKNHHEAENISAELLEFILTMRKKYKKLMFENRDNPDLRRYYDTLQKVFKIFANSWYGVAGQSSSIFFNLLVASGITRKGQSIISTSMTALERFFANNIKFENLDDALLFINNVIGEETKYIDYQNIVVPVDKTSVLKHLLGMFGLPKAVLKRNLPFYEKTLDTALSELNEEQLTRVYYKNNLRAFMNCPYVLDMFRELVDHETKFYDPNHIPEELDGMVKSLWDVTREFVFYRQHVFNRLGLIRTQSRKAVIIVDTDSNFLNLDPQFKHLVKKLNIKADEDTTFKLINTLTYFATSVIQEIFWKYTEDCNVPEEKRRIINMKNEFFMTRVVNTPNKKSYASVLKLQEGTLFNPPKVDIKGLTIKKSNVNRNIGNALQKLLEEDILKAETINYSTILSKLDELADLIRQDFIDGKTTFMTPAKIADPDSYKTPYQIGPYRGAIVWNHLRPDNMITYPAQINTVKLKIDTLDDIKDLYNTNREEYQLIKKYVFDNKNLMNYGFSILSVPKNEKNLPKWLIPYIDIDSIVKDNLANFLIILQSIGIKVINTTADDMFVSNIIEF